MARQQVNMIMVGATDIQALRRFYEQGLGWTSWRSGGSGSIMYKVGYSVLVFLNADYLSRSAARASLQGPRQVWRSSSSPKPP